MKKGRPKWKGVLLPLAAVSVLVLVVVLILVIVLVALLIVLLVVLILVLIALLVVVHVESPPSSKRYTIIVAIDGPIYTSGFSGIKFPGMKRLKILL